MQAIKNMVKSHRFYKDLKIDTIAKASNRTKNMAKNYMYLLIEISNRYFNVKKKYFNKPKFIFLVSTTIDPKISQDDVDKLFFNLSFEEQQSLDFHLNYFLHNVKKKDIYYGLNTYRLAEDMIREDITSQKEYLSHGTSFIEKYYLRDIKNVREYDDRRKRIESAMQDLLWARLLKNSSEIEEEESSKDSKSEQSFDSKLETKLESKLESKLTKKELLIKLRECEKKLNS